MSNQPSLLKNWFILQGKIVCFAREKVFCLILQQTRKESIRLFYKEKFVCSARKNQFVYKENQFYKSKQKFLSYKIYGQFMHTRVYKVSGKMEGQREREVKIQHPPYVFLLLTIFCHFLNHNSVYQVYFFLDQNLVHHIHCIFFSLSEFGTSYIFFSIRIWYIIYIFFSIRIWYTI